MNYDYSNSDEIGKDIDLARTLSDAEFEKHFNLDAEDRKTFIQELQSDFDELSGKEEEEELMYGIHYVDDWREAYAYPGICY